MSADSRLGPPTGVLGRPGDDEAEVEGSRRSAVLLYQKHAILLDYDPENASRLKKNAPSSSTGRNAKHEATAPSPHDGGQNGRGQNGLRQRPTNAANTALWLMLSMLGTLLIGVATLAVTTNSFAGTVNIFRSTAPDSSDSSSPAPSPPPTSAANVTSRVVVSPAVKVKSATRESIDAELSNIQLLLGSDDDGGDSSGNYTIFQSYVDALKNQTDDAWQDFNSTDIITSTREDDDDDDDGGKYKKNDLPNIIFMLADDLGYNSLGDEDLDLSFATPQLSAMAQDGIIMSNYYTQESCTPARAALLTGRYPLTTGMQLASINSYQSRALPIEETLLSEVLQQEGYTTYMIGKWNLGHFHPKFLPNARGFDYSLAFMDGKNYYWSKKSPKMPQFTDLVYGDKSCYNGYDGSDMHDYSTFLYRDKAIKAIEEHDYGDAPMFLYLAFQAVHDPFFDYDRFDSGIPKHYLSTKLYNKIVSKVSGRKRRQYAMALSLMDSAVEDIVDALDEQKQLDNSYIIFTSDNGGCYAAGGKNGDLRGTKGSLWEGGTKVDAFVYSPMLADEYRGRKYTGLMHVTDWFPTVLDMAGLSYSAPSGYNLDGFSQWAFMKTASGDDSARDAMLYNYIVNIDGSEHAFDILNNAPVAVRDKEGFKLIHAYVGNPSSEYYAYEERLTDDVAMFSTTECTQSDAFELSGNYTYMLYDLTADPYETTNLYHDDAYSLIKNVLYAKIATYYANSQMCASDSLTKVSKAQKNVWRDAGNYIVPWVNIDEKVLSKAGYPVLCSDGEKMKGPFVPSYGEHVSPGQGDDEAYTRSPTHTPSLRPSFEPTSGPTHKPSRSPTHKPTREPTNTQDYFQPTNLPTVTGYTAKPTHSPDYVKPTNHPTVTGYTHKPTHSPDYIRPTNHPTVTGYTHKPTHDPTTKPTHIPTNQPSEVSSEIPTSSPSDKPTRKPTDLPTSPPTPSPLLQSDDPGAEPGPEEDEEEEEVEKEEEDEEEEEEEEEEEHIVTPSEVTHAPSPSDGGPDKIDPEDFFTHAPTPTVDGPVEVTDWSVGRKLNKK